MEGANAEQGVPASFRQTGVCQGTVSAGPRILALETQTRAWEGIACAEARSRARATRTRVCTGSAIAERI